MDGLRKLLARIFSRDRRTTAGVGETNETSVDPAAQVVAKVQEAILDGEPSQNWADLPTNRPTLRNTLNDVPAIAAPTTHPTKERHWFDGKTYRTRPNSPSDTWNRLEAFLSSTDPDQLTALDPGWDKTLEEAGDDTRPQPKRASVDLPKIRREQTPEEGTACGEALPHAAFSESLS